MISRLRALFRGRRASRPLVIVIVSHPYLPVLQNWMAAMRRIGIDDFTVVAVDEPLYQYLVEQGVDTLYRPCEPGRDAFWVHRLRVIAELLEQGRDLIHSDTDAVWLKDPRPYLEKLSADAIFSQGTFWPKDVHQQWGFVLCCGFFMLRANDRTLRFVRELKKRVADDKDDQLSCNRLLLESDTHWDAPERPYTLAFRGADIACSPAVRYGSCGDLSLALLPQRDFQRIHEPRAEAHVLHPISEKTSEGVMRVLEQVGCRFI